MKLSQLRQFRQSLLQIAEKHGVKQIYVFGSVASGQEAESSDVDFLIEMGEDSSGFSVGGFQFEAQALLGAKVDVVPTHILSKIADKEFVEAVEAQAVPL